jgi:hypothetical protein
MYQVYLDFKRSELLDFSIDRSMLLILSSLHENHDVSFSSQSTHKPEKTYTASASLQAFCELHCVQSA